MARLPRLVATDQPHHVMQCGVDGLVIFRDAEDHQTFLRFLREAARQFGLAVHAYALLPNRLHLLATPRQPDALSRVMQWVGRKYVPYFNAKYGRSGTLWHSRFKATVVESERYFMLCTRYVESLPVMEALATLPQEYRWSSFGHHAGVGPDPLITDHPMFWALGNTPFGREAAYRALFEQALSAAETRQIEEATRKGWALGSDQFKLGLSKQLSRRVEPARRGRPPKPPVVPGESQAGPPAHAPE